MFFSRITIKQACEQLNISSALIAQLVEYEIVNLGFASLNPAFGTVRNGPLIYPVIKWVPGIWKQYDFSYF